jgi:hypothetical protein
MPVNEIDKVREFGNLEYEVEMNPYLEPVARAGFDPNVVKVMQNVGSHYNPNTDEVIIGNYTGTANLSEQAHEFRHRGLEKVASEFFLNIPTLKREMPPEDFKSLLDFFETMEEQRFRKRGVGGAFGRPGSEEYKFDRQEMIAEFFEEPYEYNLPAQYYAATGEDPASEKFQRVMNINPETKKPYTDEERAAYAARTGTVIKKMLLQDTVQDQMDRLETVGQDEFRTFSGPFRRGHPPRPFSYIRDRPGDEIFKQAMLVQELARKQNDAAKNYSEGGEVMRGIGTLNETARNMTRKPRGIGFYQQYAMGGEVSGPPPMRGPDPQGIARYAKGGEVSEEPLSEYQRALIASESSGRSNVVNESGYRGLTQGGDAAISDFKDQEDLDFTDEEYINSPGLQMRFQRWYEQKTIDYVMDKGLDAYIGRVIKGVPITMSSLLGMAHIGGDFGMQQFLETGGRYDPNDGNTSLSDYGRKFANMAVYGESGGENFNRVTPEDALMSMPVEQEGSLAFYRPQARPPEIEFSAPLTSLRPQARTDSEPEMSSVNRPLALAEGQSMIEKYGLPGDMPQGGIMTATR